MADDVLLVSAAPGETRAAVAIAGRVVELAVFRPGQVLGGIWLGRVISVNRALGAAFVDIGQPRPGVLAAGDLSDGQAVTVQAVSDPHHDKGARLTAAVSLTGRMAALSPTRPGVAVSRKIADTEERARLMAIGRAQALPGEGVVLRTHAAGCEAAAIAGELQALRRRWHDAQERALSAQAPATLLPPDPIGRMLADHPAIDRVIVDDAATHAELRSRHGAMVERHATGSVFELYEAEDVLQAALEPVVPLAAGGSLVIEHTTAAVLVDVNSGGGDPGRCNSDACAALAREIRLRNLSGHILFDAIPMRGKGAARRLVDRLREAVADDPVPTEVVGATPLGLIELTRERRRASLAEIMLETRLGPSAETVALQALRTVLAGAARHGGGPRLLLAPEIAAALRRLTGAVAEAERHLARPLAVTVDPHRGREDVDIAWD
jgi:ribonuclease E/ribonuclease G